MINILVDNVSVTVTETEILTAGRVGLECSVNFQGGAWGGLVKKITFEGTESRTLILSGATVVIPWECLAESGYKLRVGVCGENANGTIVIPTLWADIGKIKAAAPRDGESPIEPTPSVIAQIQALAESSAQSASSAASSASSSASSASTAAQEATDAAGSASSAASSASAAEASAEQAATDAAGAVEAVATLDASLAPVAKSGDYNDLTNKPAIPTVPTKLSDFTDDLGSSPVHTHSQYLTEHQSLDAYRTSAAQDVIDDAQNEIISSQSSAIADLGLYISAFGISEINGKVAQSI